MNTVNKIDELFDRVNKIGVFISGIAILLMMFLIALEIVLRSVFSSSIPGSYLIVENYFMPLAVFPALAFAFASGIFPRLEVVVDKVKTITTKTSIIVFVMLVELICSVIIAYYGFVMGIEG
ncbi:TRAP transporter small permease, partial [Desertibacillus haloalkaliphilus]